MRRGAILAQLTCALLHEWHCADHVINMTFSTTASNTGHLTVMCVTIQTSLDQPPPLVWVLAPHQRDSAELHIQLSQRGDITLTRDQPVCVATKKLASFVI